MAEQAEQLHNPFELKMEQAKTDAKDLLSLINQDSSQQELSRAAERNLQISKIAPKPSTLSVNNSKTDNMNPKDSLLTEQNPTNKLTPKSFTLPVDKSHTENMDQRDIEDSDYQLAPNEISGTSEEKIFHWWKVTVADEENLQKIDSKSVKLKVEPVIPNEDMSTRPIDDILQPWT